MTGALLVLLFVFMVAVSLWSIVDAALQPGRPTPGLASAKAC
jgi:hypothetical protein